MTVAADFAEIDRQIEDLQAKLESCRKAMLLSRAAVIAAALALGLVLTVAGAYRTPVVVFSAIAALLGGTVWLGASKTSFGEAKEQLAALDAVKDRMIDRVAAANGWRDLTPTVH